MRENPKWQTSLSGAVQSAIEGLLIQNTFLHEEGGGGSEFVWMQMNGCVHFATSNSGTVADVILTSTGRIVPILHAAHCTNRIFNSTKERGTTNHNIQISLVVFYSFKSKQPSEHSLALARNTYGFKVGCRNGALERSQKKQRRWKQRVCGSNSLTCVLYWWSNHHYLCYHKHNPTTDTIVLSMQLLVYMLYIRFLIQLIPWQHQVDFHHWWCCNIVWWVPWQFFNILNSR